MKLPLIVLSFLIASSFLLKQNSVYAQTDDAFSEPSKPVAAPINNTQRLSLDYGKFNEFLVGARVNYTQGNYGFLGCSATFMWHDISYILESHIGFSAGIDFRLTKSMVYAPKIIVEYRYLIGIVRVGYSCFSNFKSDYEHRVSAEIGFSLLSFLDITYLHSFGSRRNPFQLGNDYLNITATIPLNL